MLNYNSEETRSSITKFEQMLKTNLIYFFDAQEFEDIVVHYLGFGENQLAKKALKMGLEQHPDSNELLLLQSEIFILEEKYDSALKLLDYVEKLDDTDTGLLYETTDGVIGFKHTSNKKNWND